MIFFPPSYFIWSSWNSSEHLSSPLSTTSFQLLLQCYTYYNNLALTEASGYSWLSVKVSTDGWYYIVFFTPQVNNIDTSVVLHCMYAFNLSFFISSLFTFVMCCQTELQISVLILPKWMLIQQWAKQKQTNKHYTQTQTIKCDGRLHTCFDFFQMVLLAPSLPTSKPTGRF